MVSGRARAAFVVVEGVEGAGKTTQAARLVGWLHARGIECVAAREPGGTPLGEAIRSLVVERTDLEVPEVSELLLMQAARAAFVRDVVRPALEAGVFVVADRYALSTLAYQGHGRGLELDEVRRVVELATGGLRPDLCILLDVPVETGASRQRRSGKSADRFEGEGRAFLERVREGYLDEALLDERIVRLDGAGTTDEVHARVIEAVRSRLGEAFPSLLV